MFQSPVRRLVAPPMIPAPAVQPLRSLMPPSMGALRPTRTSPFVFSLAWDMHNLLDCRSSSHQVAGFASRCRRCHSWHVRHWRTRLDRFRSCVLWLQRHHHIRAGRAINAASPVVAGSRSGVRSTVTRSRGQSWSVLDASASMQANRLCPGWNAVQVKRGFTVETTALRKLLKLAGVYSPSFVVDWL